MSYTKVNPEFPNAEDRKRRQEIFHLACYYSPKLKNHVLNCKTFTKGGFKDCYDIDCEICSKFLCFLDCMNQNEKRMKKEIDFEKMQNSGTTENMIFGDGIKLLE